MRLLILTQAVDQNDPVLGFFHHWITGFAGRFDRVHVICLKEGKHALPHNVAVHSLGKESGPSRGKYVSRFFPLVWSLRNEYDVILVHMNQEYVLLGGFLWKLLGKRIYMWRNHYAGTLMTNLAVALCTKVFCTSRFSYTARFKKTVLMPVGVDLGVFKQVGQRIANSILFLARFAPSKHPERLVQALKKLRQEGMPFTASFYGSAEPSNEAFRNQVRTDANELGDTVRFLEGVPNTDTPRVYSAHDIFVDLSASGMYNKTIYEAAACGCLVLAASKDYAEHVDSRLVFEEDGQDLAEKLRTVLALPESEKNTLRASLARLAESHSLEALSKKLAEEIRV